MQPTQFYETEIHNRDTGDAFTFITVPTRSLPGREVPNAEAVAETLRIEVPRVPQPAEPWALPFLVDALMGRPLDYPWILEPGGRQEGQTPSPFAQYVTYSAVIPFEESPLDNKSLAGLLAGTTGSTAIVVGFAAGHPIMLLVVPAGIILCGAATGIAQALQIGLRTHLLRFMGVEDEGGEPGP